LHHKNELRVDMVQNRKTQASATEMTNTDRHVYQRYSEKCI